MDVSPKQIVSAAASLIPFLEHDDANRALMDCNMQRQAVPLLRTEAPIVGTGMEKKIAIDVVTAEDSGVVESVTADAITIRYDDAEKIARQSFFDTSGMVKYRMRKFKRSKTRAPPDQKPPGAAGAEGEEGRRVLGRRAEHRARRAGAQPRPCSAPCRGAATTSRTPSFSERCVKEDLFTSLHIEEFELQVRDTKRGVEEVTREIPNVSEEALRNTTRRGSSSPAPRCAGNMLVGKVTPKGETELSPEEKLLRAIFGEKAGDVKDASLKARPASTARSSTCRSSPAGRTERSREKNRSTP